MTTATILLCESQVELARSIVDRAQLDVQCVVPSSPRDAGAIRSVFDCTMTEDVRGAITSVETELVLILDPGTFGSERPEDVSAVASAIDRSVRMLSLEPLPASFALASAPIAMRKRDNENIWSRIEIVPLLRHAPNSLQIGELFADFGQPDWLHIDAIGRSDEGTLGARLIDVLATVLDLFGDPEQVDTTIVSREGQLAVHPVPGDSLSHLTGSMSCMMRFSDGRGAGLSLSDRASRWSRTVRFVGTSGVLEVDDSAARWTDRTGKLVERVGTEPGPVDLAALIAGEIKRDPATPHAAPPLDLPRVLAFCGACLLSARTGEPESIETILRIGAPA